MRVLLFLKFVAHFFWSSPRIPDPPRGEDHYPSEIEQLLRDYGRARQEARTEIARARERLRERTEQEKRRLQQQALSQVVKVSSGSFQISRDATDKCLPS